MTREEAIQQLDGAEVMVFNRDAEKLKKAVIVALNALRAPITPHKRVNHPQKSKGATKMKKQIIKQYTEENYTPSELERIFVEEAMNSRQKGYNVELIAQHPIVNNAGQVVGVDTAQSIVVNTYRLVPEEI